MLLWAGVHAGLLDTPLTCFEGYGCWFWLILIMCQIRCHGYCEIIVAVDSSDTNTLTPILLILTLPAACTELQTPFPIGLEPQKRWFQKWPKSAETRGRHVWVSPSQDKGGGGYCECKIPLVIDTTVEWPSADPMSMLQCKEAWPNRSLHAVAALCRFILQ